MWNIQEMDKRLQEVFTLADEKFNKANNSDRLLLNCLMETIKWTQGAFADQANAANNNFRIILERLDRIEKALNLK